MSELRLAVNDGLVMTWRNLKRVPRIPELAIFAILQSIMFVALFAYVFGGAIPLPDGGSYREYLMPGIFIQTLGFASITTAIAVTDDMAKGLIDRFRSLPMARSAVLSGRTVSDVVYNLGILIVLMLSGLLVGWRVHNGLPDFLLAVLLMLYFTFAMAWIGVWIGLQVPSVEVGQQLGFLIIFPLTFVSNAFVPVETLPQLAAADRGVEPVQRAHLGDPGAVRQPEPVHLGLPGRAPILPLDRLDDRAARRLRPARGAEVPRDRPLRDNSRVDGGAGWTELRAGRWEAARAAFAALPETAESLEGLSWAAWWLDDADAVFDARERAHRLYREAGNPSAAARMATWLASDELDFHGAATVAGGWLRRARRLLEPLEPGPDHGWLAFHEGYVAHAEGDRARAVELAVAAAEIGRRFDVPDLEMLGLALEGAAQVAAAEVEAGMGCLDEATAAALAGEATIPISSAWTCCFLVSACTAVRDYERASEWCDRIAEFAARYGSRYMLGFCRAEYGAVHLWRGHWAEAEALLDRRDRVVQPLAARVRRRPGRPAGRASAPAGTGDGGGCAPAGNELSRRTALPGAARPRRR